MGVGIVDFLKSVAGAPRGPGKLEPGKLEPGKLELGKVVKSNSHCDYVVQLHDRMSVVNPPEPDDCGFGSFVKLGNGDRSPIVGIVYNSQLLNPLFLNNGPRLSSEPDPVFAPDLINETRTLLGVALIGTLVPSEAGFYGEQGIPREIVPVNTRVTCMGREEIHRFHRDLGDRPQFRYYNLLLRYGGSFAADLAEQVLQELIDLQLFAREDQRALETLCKELTWRNTLGSLR